MGDATSRGKAPECVPVSVTDKANVGRGVAEGVEGRRTREEQTRATTMKVRGGGGAGRGGQRGEQTRQSTTQRQKNNKQQTKTKNDAT